MGQLIRSQHKLVLYQELRTPPNSFGVIQSIDIYSGSFALSAGNLTLDCNGRVKAGEKTQVTCRGPNKLHSGMYIYRPNASNGNELVIRCKYDYGSCLNPIKSYTFQKRAGEVKVIIERFDPNTDVGKWVCCDGPFSGVNRNMATCMKKGNCKFRIVKQNLKKKKKK